MNAFTDVGPEGRVERAAKAVELALPGAEIELAMARLGSEVRCAREVIEALLRDAAEPIPRRA